MPYIVAGDVHINELAGDLHGSRISTQTNFQHSDFPVVIFIPLSLLLDGLGALPSRHSIKLGPWE